MQFALLTWTPAGTGEIGANVLHYSMAFINGTRLAVFAERLAIFNGASLRRKNTAGSSWEHGKPKSSVRMSGPCRLGCGPPDFDVFHVVICTSERLIVKTRRALIARADFVGNCSASGGGGTCRGDTPFVFHKSTCLSEIWFCSNYAFDREKNCYRDITSSILVLIKR